MSEINPVLAQEQQINVDIEATSLIEQNNGDSPSQEEPQQDGFKQQRLAFSHWLRRAFTRDANADLQKSGGDSSPTRLASPTSSASSTTIPVVTLQPDLQPVNSPDLELGTPSTSAAENNTSSNNTFANRPPVVSTKESMRKHTTPTCLICLETLTSEDFQQGRAMMLDCKCLGDLALRHKDCAIKWSHYKGDTICELCKSPVKNLPDVPPPQNRQAATTTTNNNGTVASNPHHPFIIDEDNYSVEAPDINSVYRSGPADAMFDSVRIAWVAMIVSVLFFGQPLGAALWTGLIAGIMYSLLMRMAIRGQMAALAAQQMRDQAGASSPV